MARPIPLFFVIFVLIASPGCENDAAPTSPGARAAPAGPARPVAGVDADDVESALRAAADYVSREELPKAEAILARLIERAPGESRAHELMGQVVGRRAMIAAAAGDREAARAGHVEAYEHYGRAAEADPGSAGLQQSAGVMAMMASRPDRALEHFRSAERLDPSSPQHPLYVAQILMQRGEAAAARAALERVLALDGDEPLAHASLAMIDLEADRFTEALARITVAREIAPGDLRFRVQEARIHRRAGDPRRGLEMLVMLSEDERADAAVAYELAACHTARGEHRQAAEVWVSRVRLRPGEDGIEFAAVSAGDAYLSAGETERARDWLERARRIGGETDETRALGVRLEERDAG